MDPKALFNISYGVFILGVKTENKINACVTNTCFQCASEPVRIAISVLNQNLTCQMIQEKGSFSLSVLDKTCTFETIKRFGMQSGRNADKFDGFDFSTDSNGNPYPDSQICTLLTCKVISSQNLGTHTLFIAEVQDAQIKSNSAPITYTDYQKDIKPKTSIKPEKKIVGWRCKICSYVYEGSELPADYTCPLCGHPAEDFEPIYE